MSSAVGPPQLKLPLVEVLERRLMCHAGEIHDGSGSPAHLSLDEFHLLYPDITTNPWDIDNFDPGHSGDPAQFRYDPHLIEDDGTYTPPAPSPASGPRTTTLMPPDLIPITTSNYFQPFLDTTEIPGRNLLRFSAAVGNIGGPVLLTSAADAIDPQGRQIVTQTVYNYDSVANSFSAAYQREAGRFVWHPGHGHFHVEGYASYRLLTSVNGQPGPIAMRADGTPAVGDKIGFCLINSLLSFTLPGGASSTTITGYSASGQLSTSCGFVQGLQSGRGDVYLSIYDGQWIDVTGVANGNYFVEVTMDAGNTIQESDESNNTVIVPYTLNANPPVGGIQPDRFEPNNDFASATDLGELGVQTQSGLTIHTTNEADYFRFTAASSGTYSVQLQVADRDVNLFLYGADMSLIESSTSATVGPMVESVTAPFVKGQTYYVAAKGFGISTGTSGVSGNYALRIVVNPTVDAQTLAPTASAGTGAGLVRIHRNGPFSSPLTVNLSISGTAEPGVDYDALPSSIIIGNEANDFDIPVNLASSAVIGQNRSVVVSISADSGYVIGNPSATVTLLENVRPTVTADSYEFETGRRLRITFSEDVGVSLTAGSLHLVNRGSGQEVAASSMQYDAGSNVATFTLSNQLANGEYLPSLAGVTDAAGNPLAPTTLASFFVLAGDANSDRQVDISDLAIVATNWQQSPRTFSQGDLNYDGKVDVSDLAIVGSAWQSTLPAPTVEIKPLPASTRRPLLVTELLE